MRHLGSLALSVLLTAVLYVLVGIGISKWVESARSDGTHSLANAAVVLLAFLGAAALYGLLLLLRLSPVGLVLAGLMLLILGAWAMLASGAGPFHYLPRNIGGFTLALSYPAYNGYALFLAVPLLMTMLSPRRWRRYAQPRPAAVPAAVAPYPAPAGGYPPPPGPAYPGASAAG